MTDEGRTVFYVCPFCGYWNFRYEIVNGNGHYKCKKCRKVFAKPTTNLEYEKKENK